MFVFRALFVSFFIANACGNINDFIARFDKWVETFSFRFIDETHYAEVFRKWRSNDEFITEVNGKNLSYTLGHNQFSGMDIIDFSAYINRFNTNDKYINNDMYVNYYDKMDGETLKYNTNSYLRTALPSSVDWVEQGAVTGVKDQGQCGSCWSFSTTGALEGAYYIKNGVLKSFSEQQLVDCDNYANGGRDHGCNGGLMDNAFTWISKNGGLCLESSYPYVSGATKTSGTCQKTCSLVAGSKVAKYVDVTPNSDSAMMTALSMQPVSIAIEADQQTFQLYKSGVFTGTCGTNLDHGVLAVGYGSENGDDYYLVKNSWGTSWGQNGYIKLGRGSQYNKGSGQCGILMEGSYPLL